MSSSVDFFHILNSKLNVMIIIVLNIVDELIYFSRTLVHFQIPDSLKQAQPEKLFPHHTNNSQESGRLFETDTLLC